MIPVGAILVPEDHDSYYAVNRSPGGSVVAYRGELASAFRLATDADLEAARAHAAELAAAPAPSDAP